MTADRSNRRLTLDANLEVSVGLILLIVEIDQNSQLVRVEIYYQRGRIQFHLAIGSDPIGSASSTSTAQ